MSELRIRNIDPWVVDVFRGNAKRHGRSMEQELREILSEAAVREKNAFLDSLQVSRDRQRVRYGVLPDSTPGIRAERDNL